MSFLEPKAKAEFQRRAESLFRSARAKGLEIAEAERKLKARRPPPQRSEVGLLIGVLCLGTKF
jgi:hypothetical protein